MIIFIYGYDDPFYMDTEYPTSLSPPPPPSSSSSSSLSSLLKSKKTNSIFQNLHTFYWINGIDSRNPYRGYYESYMNKRKYSHHHDQHHHHRRRRRRHRRHHQNRQFLSLQTDLFKLLKAFDLKVLSTRQWSIIRRCSPMEAGDQQLVHMPFVPAGYWSPCAPLIWNPVRAPNIRFSFSHFRKQQHPATRRQ
ncbi:unnamed protein product [Schistosoma curassoni]|uniref:Uncharacterized protein n=1 Tax=Schistosoma curassoni TaxID=6186 RepID=A0A183JX69_9TREM|nr:unnamed protein product [Schistosoma curassoni]